MENEKWWRVAGYLGHTHWKNDGQRVHDLPPHRGEFSRLWTLLVATSRESLREMDDEEQSRVFRQSPERHFLMRLTTCSMSVRTGQGPTRLFRGTQVAQFEEDAGLL